MNKWIGRPDVRLVMAAMKGLLASRRDGKIKRLAFLKAWGRLRMLITGSPEYQAWRQSVRKRAGGACEQCGEIGVHAHHKTPVSRNVDKVFDLSNGELLCYRCHNSQPGHNLRGRGRATKPASRKDPNQTPNTRLATTLVGWSESSPLQGTPLPAPARRASMSQRINS